MSGSDPLIGQTISHYRIMEKLGGGGMGVVYKAQDTRLDRFVALKFLPSGLSRDRQALERFHREAKAASALNHPNICTIYDIGEENGRVFIAMELLEGQTLKSRIVGGPIDPGVIAEIGAQIADALDAAHSHEIIHRDIKPANIFITRRGHAKILDFGLAKQMRKGLAAATTIDGTTVEDDPLLTSPGEAVGTVAYMSPEQARGEELDARTDLFSFGIVLYEMATARQAFSGATSAVIFDAILHKAPTSPVRLNPQLPQELERILNKALEKDRNLRYQHASEMRADLKRLQRDTDSGRSGATVAEKEPAVAQPARRARRYWMPVGVGLGILVLLVAGFELLRLRRAAPPSAARHDWVQLTDFADSAVSPALSPDGRMLAFIRGNDTFVGDGQIYVKLLPDGEPVQLTNDHLNKMSPEFSPDGSTIAYTVAHGVPWDTWVVPVLGGEPRLMLPNAEGLTWIDPGHLLFSEFKSGIHMALATASVSRTESRDIYVPPRERGMAHRSALSPDHKWVLVAEMDNSGWLPCRLVPFDGSSAGRPVGPEEAGCTYAAWSPDGAWMYFSSDAGGRFHIWRQRFPNGEPEQVTSGPTEEEGIAVAPDGNSLVTSSGLRESTLWVRDSRGERQVSSEGYAGNPKFSPDGKRLYYLVRRHGITGQFVDGELWVVNLETNRSEHLLPGFLVSGYDISPDGKRVVFSATDAQDHSHLWTAELDLRSSPQRLPSSVDEDYPRWRAEHIYARAEEGKSNFVYRMKEDGSERIKLLSDPILFLDDASPDGEWVVVATSHVAGQDLKRPRVVAFPVGGGPAVTVCVVNCAPRWNAGGSIFSMHGQGMEGKKTLQMPVSLGRSLPSLPPGGLQTWADVKNVKGAKVLDGSIIAGPTPDLSATLHQNVHRNLYRVPLQ
jgi:Tol biopolymer transport system component